GAPAVECGIASVGVHSKHPTRSIIRVHHSIGYRVPAGVYDHGLVRHHVVAGAIRLDQRCSGVGSDQRTPTAIWESYCARSNAVRYWSLQSPPAAGRSPPGYATHLASLVAVFWWGIRKILRVETEVHCGFAAFELKQWNMHMETAVGDGHVVEIR